MEFKLDFYKPDSIKISIPFVNNIIKGVLEEVVPPRDRGVSIAVAIVSDQEIKKINKKYRDQNKITDVLSFGVADDFVDVEGRDLGEIIIASGQCTSQAREFGASFEDEFTRLLIHGLLHNLGYDHRQDKEALIMTNLEKKIIRKIK